MFVLTKLFWILASPGNLLVLLLAAGVLRRGFRVVAATSAVLVAIILVPIDNMLFEPLENRFPPPDPLPARIDGIVLLGSGGTTGTHGRPAISGTAAERIMATIELARREARARIILSGGDGELIPGQNSEAETMRRFLAAYDIDPARLVVENRSRNTFENAVESQVLVRPKRGETWLLVAPAAQMPRAIGCFRHVGFPILAYPVGYQIGTGLNANRFDFAENLSGIERSMHEWLALIAYRALGRIDSLFPEPESTSHASQEAAG